MQLITLQSGEDGKLYQGFVYRDEHRDMRFHYWSERYSWQDSPIDEFKPVDISMSTTKSNIDSDAIA